MSYILVLPYLPRSRDEFRYLIWGYQETIRLNGYVIDLHQISKWLCRRLKDTHTGNMHNFHSLFYACPSVSREVMKLLGKRPAPTDTFELYRYHQRMFYHYDQITKSIQQDILDRYDGRQLVWFRVAIPYLRDLPRRHQVLYTDMFKSVTHIRIKWAEDPIFHELPDAIPERTPLKNLDWYLDSGDPDPC